MRKITIVSLLLTLLIPRSLHAVGVDLPSIAAHAPENSWLSSVSDRITRHRTVHTVEACGSPLACSKVIATALWQCERAFPAGTFAVRATLSLYGAIYYFDGPFAARKRAFDRTVVDARSAVSHEYTWHIIPAAAAVFPIVEALEAQRFETRQRCEDAARDASERVTSGFQQALADTQEREQSGIATG